MFYYILNIRVFVWFMVWFQIFELENKNCLFFYLVPFSFGFSFSYSVRFLDNTPMTNDMDPKIVKN